MNTVDAELWLKESIDRPRSLSQYVQFQQQQNSDFSFNISVGKGM